MRGADEQTSGMFSYLSPEQRVRADHPLRAIRRLTDAASAASCRRSSTAMYATIGRPSIPPEQLLRALLLQIALQHAQRAAADGGDRLQHAVPLVRRAEPGRADLVADDLHQESRPVAGAATSRRLLRCRRPAGAGAGLLSDEHFTVDGTQLEAWARLKSFTRRDDAAAAAARRSGQSDRGFPRRAPHECDPSVDDRPRCAAASQGRRSAARACAIWGTC